jgi:hypothetical protein
MPVYINAVHLRPRSEQSTAIEFSIQYNGSTAEISMLPRSSAPAVVEFEDVKEQLGLLVTALHEAIGSTRAIPWPPIRDG